MKQFLLLFLYVPVWLQAQLPQPCDPSMTVVSPTFENACINCGFQGYVGSTAGWDAQPVPPDFCGVNPAPRWLGFIAPATQLSYTITPQNCTGGKGMQAALYHDADEPALVCSAGCDTCGNVPLVLNATNLVIGANYYFLLSGYDQDVCDFTISPSFPGIPGWPTGQQSVLTGPVTVCPGGSFDYNTNTIIGAGYYIWESSDPGVTFNGIASPAVLEGPALTTVTAKFPDFATPTQLYVCVTPANSCHSGAKSCKFISVINSPVTNLPKVVVCNEDAPFTLPWGATATTTGPYEHTYTTQSGCDSIVRQWVEVLGPKQSTIIKSFCAEGTVSVCGHEFSQSGEYQIQCTSYNGCDSIVTLKLNILAPVAEIIGGDTISVCGNLSAKLYSEGSPNAPGVSIKSWKNLTNGNVSTGDTYSVTQSSIYTLSTSMTAGGTVCVEKDTVYVDFRPELPALNAFASMSNPINCIDSISVLSGGADSVATHFNWLGPAGFSADTSTVLVDMAGYYYFSAANDMCDEIIPVVLPLDTYPGSMTIGATKTGCNKPATVSGNPSPSGLILQWTTPGNETLSGIPITVYVPGVYTVLATNPDNGCTFSKSIEVLADTIVPAVSVSVNHAINGQQNGSVIAITLAGTPPFTYLWTQNNTTVGTSSTLINLQAGIYLLQVTGSNGCDTIITVEVKDIISGVSEPSATQHWKVSPNPAAQKFVLQHVGQSPIRAAIIRCIDPAGKVVFNSNLPANQAELSVDCSRFEAVIYMLEIVPLDHTPVERLRVVVIR